MNNNLENAVLIAKINALKSYIGNLLIQLEEEFDDMDDRQGVKYDDPDLQYKKGLVEATEIIKRYVEAI